MPYPPAVRRLAHSGLGPLAAAVLCFTAVSWLTGAGHARADGGAPGAPVASAESEARELFERGVAALQRGAWAEAEELLRGSLEKSPRVATAYNLATALESQGRLEAAVRVLETLLRGEWGVVEDAQQIDSRDRVARMRARFGEVSLLVAGPEAARIRVEGSDTEASTRDGLATLNLEPGPRTLLVDAPGFLAARVVVTVVSKERTRVEQALTPLPGILRVATKPNGELITVEGLGSFRAPFERTLPASTYEVLLAGNPSTRRSVDLPNGQTVTVTLERPESGGSSTGWWLVGGAAVVVVAGTVAAILLLSSGDDPSAEASPYFPTITALSTP